MIVFLVAAPALATDFAVNVGVIEVAALPGPAHAGAYPYLAGSAVLPAGQLLLIPGLGVEWSPELGRWGLVGTLVVDRPVNDWLGVDLIAALLHDQAGASVRSSDFYAGVGVGGTVVAGPVAISPSFSLYRGLDVGGWSLVPGLNFAYVL